MLRLLILLMTTLSLSACLSTKPTTFPAEFANLDYELSDQDARRWAIASTQVEQCIYPNLTRIQREHFSKEDAYIHSQYVFFYPLEEIIGEQYVKMIQADEKSMGYATLQYKKFKQRQEKPLEEEPCRVLRMQAKDDLAVIKGQYKSGMAEENPLRQDKHNPDGVATNQNKFFFDIIKWGAALLL
ncbi:DUF5358 domain-containing protein [Pasteurella multocida]|uniref:DUF5358 domain-containing protein n=1 Tax=Pasteurella multocida TaxID=747 RepID=UPI0008FACB91|nr:DUF5358 domain-containing protein [Pasteurella multocida]MDC4234728.1 DUF5358 domain-containing protein [Pasteurella multocida]OIQ14561.1 hypothetical protein UR07_04305 [Pasteurella multocida subsp. multocida]PNW25459.1 hypothetical protein AP056_00930 [Pasteurella multocida subsp. multocida]